MPAKKFAYRVEDTDAQMDTSEEAFCFEENEEGMEEDLPPPYSEDFPSTNFEEGNLMAQWDDWAEKIDGEFGEFRSKVGAMEELL